MEDRNPGRTESMLYDLKKWFFERMGLNYMTAGKSLQSEKWYKKLEAMEPDNLAVLHNLGVICISLKKFTAAESYLKREIEIYGESGIRLRVLGDLYYIEGSMDKAGKVYGKALTLFQENGNDRNTENFLMKRIKICNDKTLSARAIESGILLEKSPALLSNGKFNDALDLFLKAAEYDKSSYMALNSAGTVLLNNIKDYARARECFRKALELADIHVIKSNLALAEYKIKMEGENR